MTGGRPPVKHGARSSGFVTSVLRGLISGENYTQGCDEHGAGHDCVQVQLIWTPDT